MTRPVRVNDYDFIAESIKTCSQIFKNGIQVGPANKCDNYCSFYKFTQNTPVMEGNLSFLKIAVDAIT